MPHKARIDLCGVASAKKYAPGALHHIIVRGMECRRIFSDDQDRDNFVERLGDIVTKTQTGYFTWVLIPNHVHIFTVKERSLMCYWAAIKLGFSTTELSKKLGVSQPSVSISVTLGEKIAKGSQL